MAHPPCKYAIFRGLCPFNYAHLYITENAVAIIPIHPGEHLAEELKELGMSAAELARQLDVPTNRITEILNGRRAITGDTALRLAHFFGTTAEFRLCPASAGNGESVRPLR